MIQADRSWIECELEVKGLEVEERRLWVWGLQGDLKDYQHSQASSTPLRSGRRISAFAHPGVRDEVCIALEGGVMYANADV